MKAREFRIGAGKVNIEIQENTAAHYISRWAATLVVFVDGTVVVKDGRPHEDRPTGHLKVNGTRVVERILQDDDEVTLSDCFVVPWHLFEDCFSPDWVEPTLLVDQDMEEEFLYLHTIERKFDIWNRIENISTRYAFMSLTPLIWGVIRTATEDAPFNPLFAISTVALTVFSLAIVFWASYKRSEFREQYRCPHCGKRLSAGKRLRSWDELEEDNRCPRCAKFYMSR